MTPIGITVGLRGDCALPPDPFFCVGFARGYLLITDINHSRN